MEDELGAVRHLKSGDISGLEYLVVKYQVKAVRVAYLITRDQSLAQDIVQAAFIRVFERISQFDDQRPFGPWFLKIVVNDAIKAAKRQHLLVSLDHLLKGGNNSKADITNSKRSLEDMFDRKTTQHKIQEAMSKLSPEQRTVLVLRYFLGLKEKDIADNLNSSLGTVKWRLHTARQHIRAQLRAKGELAEGSEGSKNG